MQIKRIRLANYQEDIDKMENSENEEIIEYLKNDIETLRDNVDIYDDDFKELVEKYNEKREED